MEISTHGHTLRITGHGRLAAVCIFRGEVKPTEEAQKRTTMRGPVVP